MITPAQIRGARAMLGITQADLAAASGISTTAFNNIERGASDPKSSTLDAIEKALIAAGVIFVAENGEGPGVRLRKTPAAHAATEAEMHASAAEARSKAADAVDDALSGTDATPAQKADRRSELTDEPAVIGRARDKGRGRKPV